MRFHFKCNSNLSSTSIIIFPRLSNCLLTNGQWLLVVIGPLVKQLYQISTLKYIKKKKIVRLRIAHGLMLMSYVSRLCDFVQQINVNNCKSNNGDHFVGHALIQINSVRSVKFFSTSSVFFAATTDEIDANQQTDCYWWLEKKLLKTLMTHSCNISKSMHH